MSERRVPLLHARACRQMRVARGFTFIEAIISVTIVALIGIGAVTVYSVGLRNLESQSVRVQLDSHLRGHMEILLAAQFDRLPTLTAGAPSDVSVQGQLYPVTWSADNIDLDGDFVAENDAKQLTVTIDSRSLTTIVVDTSE